MYVWSLRHVCLYTFAKLAWKYAWSPHACMYVCMSRKPSSVYVCMYVWSPQACMYGCPKHTYTVTWHQASEVPWACVDVRKPRACPENETYIHSHTLLKTYKNALPRVIFVYVCLNNRVFCCEKWKYTFLTVTHQEALHYVCMFENPVFYWDKWNIHTLLFTRLFLWMIWFVESVCFKTQCFAVLFDLGT